MKFPLTLPAIILASLLAGCAATPALRTEYLPPWQRDMRPHDCQSYPCRVMIDPRAAQWVAEYILANPGGVIHFEIKDNVAKFDGEGIVFKTDEGRLAVKCPQHEGGDYKRVCRIVPKAPREVAFAYGIKLQNLPQYDPFVWNR